MEISRRPGGMLPAIESIAPAERKSP
jgi:hypothetical protein